MTLVKSFHFILLLFFIVILFKDSFSFFQIAQARQVCPSTDQPEYGRFKRSPRLLGYSLSFWIFSYELVDIHLSSWASIWALEHPSELLRKSLRSGTLPELLCNSLSSGTSTWALGKRLELMGIYLRSSARAWVHEKWNSTWTFRQNLEHLDIQRSPRARAWAFGHSILDNDLSSWA